MITKEFMKHKLFHYSVLEDGFDLSFIVFAVPNFNISRSFSQA